MHKNGQSAKWLKRPLDTELFEYAAGDIQRISYIYDHFTEKGYLNASNFDKFMDQSQRFVSIYRNVGRPGKDDKFRQSRYLPLGILDAPGTTKGGKRCETCLRILNASMFPFAPGFKKKHRRTQLSNCRLCHFLIQIEELKKKRQDARKNVGQLAEAVAQLNIS